MRLVSLDDISEQESAVVGFSGLQGSFFGDEFDSTGICTLCRTFDGRGEPEQFGQGFIYFCFSALQVVDRGLQFDYDMVVTGEDPACVTADIFCKTAVRDCRGIRTTVYGPC